MPIAHVSSDLDTLEFREDFEIPTDELRARIERTHLDITDALKSYVPEVDDFQKRVIEAEQYSIRVVAPAGSGKTQTMINRVIHRIKAGLKPNRILLLTFDTAAVQSLKNCISFIRNEFDLKDIEGVEISTINSFGYKLIREYISNEYKQVIPSHRQIRFLREIREELKKRSIERYAAIPGNIKDRYFLDLFSVFKNELFDPREFDSQKLTDFIVRAPQTEPLIVDTKDKDMLKKVVQAVLWLFEAYEKVMQRERLMDFDDQKLRAFIFLEKNQSFLKMVQSFYSEIIVDEFQDINKLDFRFIEAISRKSILIVTGDDDQAIYGFRGCSPDYIIDLDKHLNRVIESYELNINYRCPINIVEHADKLIRHNKRRIEKNPIARNQDESEIKIVSSLTAGIEAKLVISVVKKLRKLKSDFKHKDIAVLYRTNAQSLPLQIELILNEIPYFVRPEDNILENEILEKLLGILRLKIAIDYGRKATARDSVYSVESYFRFVGAYEKNRLLSLFKLERDYLEIITSPEFYAILPKAEQSKFPGAMQEVISARTLLSCLEVLSKRFKGLEGMIGSLEDAMEEKLPLGEIFEVAADFRGSITDFVRTMERAINIAKNSNAGKDEELGVKLLTYFKAKGLQWHTIVMTSCNEGLIPHKRGQIEDERRLFYVAMTRAQKNLFISYVKRSCRTNVSPSRFLYEAGLLQKK